MLFGTPDEIIQRLEALDNAIQSDGVYPNRTSGQESLISFLLNPYQFELDRFVLKDCQCRQSAGENRRCSSIATRSTVELRSIFLFVLSIVSPPHRQRSFPSPTCQASLANAAALLPDLRRAPRRQPVPRLALVGSCFSSFFRSNSHYRASGDAFSVNQRLA